MVTESKVIVMDALIPTPAGHSGKVTKCTDSNNNSGRRSPSRAQEKYSLRPRSVVRRLQLGSSRDGLPQRSARSSKSKPPPLSKYRRKTANARERHRMKEINDAFETLRGILPEICSGRTAAAMTKITTLRLAVSYIRTLSRILQDGHPGDIFDDLHIHDVTLNDSQLTSISGVDITQLYRPETSHITSHLPPSRGQEVLTSFTFSPVSRSFSTDSDLSDILSDDSCCVFEDNLHAFDDIPALPEADPFALILAAEGEAMLMGS
ncbi:uncharacterized protein [Procambarus clarkii]|uniref:uncharacterized protein n=1 Tax=Procambarus clarkii TaxID=6728 RepID=UPI001E673B7E|nr:achaete-scute complex protein T5-like [Procambarus clarkii]